MGNNNEIYMPISGYNRAVVGDVPAYTRLSGIGPVRGESVQRFSARIEPPYAHVGTAPNPN